MEFYKYETNIIASLVVFTNAVNKGDTSITNNEWYLKNDAWSNIFLKSVKQKHFFFCGSCRGKENKTSKSNLMTSGTIFELFLLHETCILHMYLFSGKARHF